ncbi:MAG: tripartite tricarboxylate transporter TctB family protein [Aurantimonas endophytica]|uniref:tripartite tricarboxylate transporter TctB family protein n=1 Tax=Aurantimonas endophytica TaxID=1522175 RepID=UPI0030030061
MSENVTSSGTGRRPDWAAVAIGVALLALAGVIFWNTLLVTGGAYTQIGPKAFPYAIAAFLGVLSIWTIASALKGGFPEREHDAIGPIVWIVGGLTAQLLLLNVAGFSIATGLLFAATAKAFGRGPLWKTIPIGILLSLSLWLLFTKLLKLSLPAGVLERLFG